MRISVMLGKEYFMASGIGIGLLLLCFGILSSDGKGVEEIKMPLCNQSYHHTMMPNVFSHQTQDEAILHMHLFSPLIATFCARNVVFFLCLAHFPSYQPTPPRERTMCKSLCEEVFSSCTYAMDRLNFHWPSEISCNKFPETDCTYIDDPRRPQDPPVPSNCSLAPYDGGTPICSSVLSSLPDTNYFAFVNHPFVNFFNHSSQSEAVYELSKHARLIQLLISLQPDPINSTNEVTLCLNEIRFLLCSLYIARCGERSPSDYGITKSQCEKVLNKTCTKTISSLRSRGYDIAWPPVAVDCGRLPEKLVKPNNISWKSQRTFGGLSPPPPSVRSGISHDDYPDIQWQELPAEFETARITEIKILYKAVGLRIPYNQFQSRNNSIILRGLNFNTTYDVFVGTLDNTSKFPGSFDRLELKPVKGVQNVRLNFCRALYNFTKMPNLFGHTTQAEAELSMFNFFPLLDSSCSSDLRALICSAFLPRYLTKEKVTHKPCRSLCQTVFERCTYAINKLKFKWPEELQCDRLEETDRSKCYPPSTGPKPTDNETCAKTAEQSVCSLVTRAGTSKPYFASVAKNFKNYLNHTSQQQAVYALSKHRKLLSMLSLTIPSSGFLRNRYTRCVQDLTYVLCSLHLPNCASGIEISRDDCNKVLNAQSSHVCSSPVLRLQFNGYVINWPPVQFDCNTIPTSVTTGKHDFGAITFQETLPPPPAIRFRTSNQTALTLQWKEYPKRFGTPNGFQIFFKHVNSIAPYTYHYEQAGKNSAILKLDTSRDYEIFVAVFDTKLGIPGHFFTINYIRGTSIYDIPATVSPCNRFYRQTILPNRFGDQSITEAKTRMYPFFPLVYTMCSEALTSFLCSAFFPRYSGGLQQVCRSSCESVFQECTYAIGRSNFFWPSSLHCEKFQNDERCFDVVKAVQNVPSRTAPTFLLPNRRRRDVRPQCQPTTQTPICSSVKRVSFFLEERTRSKPYFSTTFLDGRKNYFNHNTKNEAVYELSRYLNLLSSLQWQRKNATYSSCFRSLTVLLCHLHLPTCPRSPLSQAECFETLSNRSECYKAIRDLNDKGANFTWPPIKVNCLDQKWFFPNASRNILHDEFSLPPPSPTKINIMLKSVDNFSISYQPTGILQTAAFFREHNTRRPYHYEVSNEKSLSIVRRLQPATDYEIKLAALISSTGFPGVFTTITTNTYGQCQNEKTGEEVAQGKFAWGYENGNDWTSASCPYGPVKDESIAGSGAPIDLPPMRFCKCDKNGICKNPFWLEPETSSCAYKSFNNSQISRDLSTLAQKLQRGKISVQNASKELVNITSRANELQQDDVILATLILERIVSSTKDLLVTGDDIVKTINNILNVDEAILTDSHRSSNSSARIVAVLERLLENIPLTLGQNVTQNEPNIAIYAQEVSSVGFEGASAASVRELQDTRSNDNFVVYGKQSGVQPAISQVSIAMPASLFKNLNTDASSRNQRIFFVVYRKTAFFTTLGKNASDFKPNIERKINSFVVSGAVKGQKLSNLQDPVVTTYIPLQAGIDQSTACVFWSFANNNGLGDWTQVGCRYQGIMAGFVTCHCSHLTNFAILMDVHTGRIEKTHEKALSIISYVGCAVSLVGLIFTIITILIFKDLRSKAPTQILLNFCIALSLTLIVFLAAAERSKTSSLAACRTAAVALHYFVLAAFVWMAINAFNMYLAFVRVMPGYYSRYILKCCAVGWGLPAVIVILTAAIAIEDYGDENFCRVQDIPFFVSFLTPVVLILVLNSIAFVLILRSLLQSGSKVTADKRATGLQQARRGTAIMVVLGLTWLFGVLAVGDARLAFQYLFCIFNSLQGLLVFIFYCVLSIETRAKYRKLFHGKSQGTETGNRYLHGMSSEGKFHESNFNKKLSNAHTTNTDEPSSTHSLQRQKMGLGDDVSTTDTDNTPTLAPQKIPMETTKM